MSQPVAKRQKMPSETTIICISRSSSPQGDDAAQKEKLKRCNDTLRDIVVTTLPALEASTYLHFDFSMQSNADFSIQRGTAFRKLRDSIITATSAVPVQLFMSPEDG